MIQRYEQGPGGGLDPNSTIGDLCMWEDVEALVISVEEVVVEIRAMIDLLPEGNYFARGFEKWIEKLEGEDATGLMG